MGLIFDHVSISYRQPVLQEVSFCVPEGEITVLLGSNGAGKTSLIRCVMGEKTDYSGTIRLGERDIRGLSLGERAGKIACLPQNLPAPHVKLRELVSYGRSPYVPLSGKLSAFDQERINWAMERAGVQGWEEKWVDYLSGGERKKAFFAMVLAQDTPLIMMDEPTAHLDSISRFHFLRLLEQLRKETRKTFLLVMHELPEVLQIAHKIVAVRDGQKVFEGTPEKFLSEGIPESVFGIRVSGNREQGYGIAPTF